MALITNFRELKAYQAARAESLRVFEISKSFPDQERFALTDQIRRSARAVGAMIAEAWTRRRYQAAFVNKLNEAIGEATETQSWLDAAPDCTYIKESEHRSLDAAWQRIGAMLHKMADRAEDFCRSAQ